MSELVLRPLVAGEESLFSSLPDPRLVGIDDHGLSYESGVASGEYRPEWSWVALRDGAAVARAAWWGRPQDSEPVALDWFDFTDFDAAVKLLRTAPPRTEYPLRVRWEWRDRPATRAAVQARVDAAQAAGLSPLVRRYRYRWTPDCGLPARPGRLVFRPEPDDTVIHAVLKDILQGSLDAHGRRAMVRRGIDAAAQEDLDILKRTPSPRDWWRLGYTADGELAGIAVPARNQHSPIIGFVGVVPAQRGHGYAYDLLVEATHALVEQGAEEILASTDMTNTPMAAHFARAGYPITWWQIDLV